MANTAQKFASDFSCAPAIPDAGVASASVAVAMTRLVSGCLAGGKLEDALAHLSRALLDGLDPSTECTILVRPDAQGDLHHDSNAAGRNDAAIDLGRILDGGMISAGMINLGRLDVAGADAVLTGPEELRLLSRGFRHVLFAPVTDGDGGAQVGLVALRLAKPPTDASAVIARAIHAAETVSVLLGVTRVTQNAEKADKSLAALAASIPGVVYQRAVRPNGQIEYTYISDSAYELFGVTAERILTDPEALFQHYGPEYRASFRKRLLDASREMSLWDVEAVINRPDGQVRYTHAIARPQKEQDGSVLWTGVILDATRIKEAELAAAAAEARTREAIVESLSQGLLLFDRNDALTIRNSHFLALYPSMAAIAVPGAQYADVVRSELDPEINPDLAHFDANDELVDRLLRHGDSHLVYERSMPGDRFILINEYRTPDEETVVLYTDISELKRRERKIEHLAHHDALTGLANRVLFNDTLESSLGAASMNDSKVAVICLDLDRFKTVNDTLGHQIGDILLKEVALRIQNCVRDTDIACRLGGDEFAVIAHDVGNGDMLTSLSWRLLHEMARPFNLAGHSIISGTSIGIAVSGHDVENSETLLRNADLALYRAKSDGRGTFRFFEREMDEKAQARRLMEIDLRGAIARNELKVHYQPLVDAHTSEVVGAEALIRWDRAGEGFVPPLEFIPLAEETGMITEIGAWVLETACRDATTWRPDIRIAVNVSPAQFRDPEFTAKVKAILAKVGLAADRLELEITESMLLRNTEANLKILYELKEAGIRISMDDFGTGYSSLGNLRSFPFSKIKIDKSFIGDLNKSVDAAAIIRAVLALGRSLGMTTTAEGVETRDQLAYLRAEGCVEVQGHYFAKAVSTEDFMAFDTNR
jgi:diguanylate cyclase (GGDEF)-like protein